MLGLEDPGNHKLSRIAARNRIRSEFIPIDSDGVQLDRLAQSGVSLMHVSPANSFSKTFVPSLRISYMVLPPALIERYLATMTFYSCTVLGLGPARARPVHPRRLFRASRAVARGAAAAQGLHRARIWKLSAHLRRAATRIRSDSTP